MKELLNQLLMQGGLCVASVLELTDDELDQAWQEARDWEREADSQAAATLKELMPEQAGCSAWKDRVAIGMQYQSAANAGIVRAQLGYEMERRRVGREDEASNKVCFKRATDL